MNYAVLWKPFLYLWTVTLSNPLQTKKKKKQGQFVRYLKLTGTKLLHGDKDVHLPKRQLHIISVPKAAQYGLSFHHF